MENLRRKRLNETILTSYLTHMAVIILVIKNSIPIMSGQVMRDAERTNTDLMQRLPNTLQLYGLKYL